MFCHIFSIERKSCNIHNQINCFLFIDLDLPAEFRVLLPQQKKEQEMKGENLYKVAGSVGYPDVKTFYQVDPVAPYATTSVIQQQQQNLMKQRVGSNRVRVGLVR